MSKIPVNEFPKYLHDAANKVDIDGDGAISAEEIAVMIEDMNHAKKLNQTLSRAMIVFGVLCVLLVGSTFGASIAAARLSKDFVVDPSTGFASAKGSGSVMKTTEALEEIELSIADLSMEELMKLHGITIENMHFDIKGCARDSLTNVTHLIIEGGFLQFNQSGLVGASAPIFDVIGLPMTEVDTDGRKLKGFNAKFAVEREPKNRQDCKNLKTSELVQACLSQ